MERPARVGGPAPRQPDARRRGFTLIELMVGIAVMGILLVVGVPAFQTVIQSNRVATSANELVSSLMYGRSEATRRGAPVTVCPSTDQTACAASTDWAEGWIVRDAAGTVLRVWPALSGVESLTGPQSVVYIGNGSVDPLPGSDFCLTVSPQHVRGIEVNRVGRVRVEGGPC